MLGKYWFVMVGLACIKHVGCLWFVSNIIKLMLDDWLAYVICFSGKSVIPRRFFGGIQDLPMDNYSGLLSVVFLTASDHHIMVSWLDDLPVSEFCSQPRLMTLEGTFWLCQNSY